tara:strand:+ start:1084 stop:1521 length:438 start_codon:yes stop_codon:yes gene_type:complete
MQNKEASKAVLNMILSNIENLNLSKRGHVSRLSSEFEYSESRAFIDYMRKLPYTIENGMVLNRGYNPLWARSDGSVSRETYFKVNDGSGGNIFFYNDGCSPWQNKKKFDRYLIILHALMDYLNPDIHFDLKSLIQVVEESNQQTM